MLSGLQPILNSETKSQKGEVAITIAGLRPGEKLFEELVYNSNLRGTAHPKINTSEEIPMSRTAVQSLLLVADGAIQDNDHKKLHEMISSVLPSRSSF